MMESIINCLEKINNPKDYNFEYDKDNMISYFYAFTICKFYDKRKEVLDKLLQQLHDDNIIHFIKVVSTLTDDEFLISYCFWLIRYIINKNEKYDDIIYNGFVYENIVKINEGHFNFDEARIFYTNSYKDMNLTANLNFLKSYNEKYMNDLNRYFTVNNYFNMGRVLRRKTFDNFNLVDDYPHYYQLVLENEPTLLLYAMRKSENSNFIISKSIVKNIINIYIG
jgi:hypothetical protein